MLRHLIHGAISVGSGGVLTTVVSYGATWTKLYRRLGEAVAEAQDIGLMENAQPVEPYGRGTAYRLQLPQAFDDGVLKAAGFVPHGQGCADQNSE